VYYLTSMKDKRGVVVLCKDKKQVASFPAQLNNRRIPALREAISLVGGSRKKNASA